VGAVSWAERGQRKTDMAEPYSPHRTVVQSRAISPAASWTRVKPFIVVAESVSHLLPVIKRRIGPRRLDGNVSSYSWSLIENLDDSFRGDSTYANSCCIRTTHRVRRKFNFIVHPTSSFTLLTFLA